VGLNEGITVQVRCWLGNPHCAMAPGTPVCPSQPSPAVKVDAEVCENSYSRLDRVCSPMCTTDTMSRMDRSKPAGAGALRA